MLPVDASYHVKSYHVRAWTFPTSSDVVLFVSFPKITFRFEAYSWPSQFIGFPAVPVVDRNLTWLEASSWSSTFGSESVGSGVWWRDERNIWADYLDWLVQTEKGCFVWVMHLSGHQELLSHTLSVIALLCTLWAGMALTQAAIPRLNFRVPLGRVSRLASDRH